MARTVRATLTAVWKTHQRLPDGATILCLGDSNTASTGAIPWPTHLSSLGVAHSWTIQSSAGGGFSVTDHGTPGGVVIGNTNFWIGAYVNTACVQAQKPTAIIVAGITNDFRVGPIVTPSDVIAEVRAQAQSCRAAGIDYYVALCPKNFPIDTTANPAVNQLGKQANDLVREAFPANHIDFRAATPTADDFQADGVHMTTSGQVKRAQVAYSVLTNA